MYIIKCQSVPCGGVSVHFLGIRLIVQSRLRRSGVVLLWPQGVQLLTQHQCELIVHNSQFSLFENHIPCTTDKQTNVIYCDFTINHLYSLHCFPTMTRIMLYGAIRFRILKLNESKHISFSVKSNSHAWVGPKSLWQYTHVLLIEFIVPQ